MADRTRIEWTEASWNPITGCSFVSEGCVNCYARRMAKRLAGRAGYPKQAPFRVTVHPERFEQPSRWRRPRMIFVCSMSDLFHPDVSEKDITTVLLIAAEERRHFFQILTKRPTRMLDIIRRMWPRHGAPPNVWCGVTAENQQRFDERVEVLRLLPSDGVRFVSAEPLLGEIDIRGNANAFDWVICGGETGPKARPMDPRWALTLRDQCRAARVPFFMKRMARGDAPPSELMVRQWPDEVTRG